MRWKKLTAWRQWTQVETTADEGRMEMQAEVTREWVTYKQAEELSGLSRTTLWKLLSAGEIKAARVGRAVRINRRSLDGYLEEAAEGS
jgi:excisionase family DNA binding protein